MWPEKKRTYTDKIHNMLQQKMWQNLLFLFPFQPKPECHDPVYIIEIKDMSACLFIA